MTPHRHFHPPAHPAFVPALVVTLAYACIEAVAGWWAGSLALLSDAGHMFSDGLALGLAAIASQLARRPAGKRHTYGWARAEVLGALLNGVLMLVIIVLVVLEAVRRIQSPGPVVAEYLLGVAFIGLLVNGWVAWILTRGEMNLNARAALLHVLGDWASSLAALLAGVVIYATGWATIDPILSLVIAGLILFSTMALLRDALHVLMEGVPRAVDLQQIGRALAGLPGVDSVHDLHVWSIASGKIALSAHVRLRDLQQWPAILSSADVLMRDRYGIGHITLQPETLPVTMAGETAVVRLWPKGSRPPR